MNYGQDVRLAPGGGDVQVDVTGDMLTIDGAALVGQDVAEALRTPRGSLPWGIDAGSDLLDMLGDLVVTAYDVQAEMRRVALADQRVDATSVDTRSPASSRSGLYEMSFRTVGGDQLIELSVPAEGLA